MTATQRIRKRALITFVYALILTLIGTWIYYAYRPAETCFDNWKNQDETGVDCGGVCAACPEVFAPADFVVQEAAFVPGSNPGDYDVLARVQNPNDVLGASELTYTFSLLGADHSVLATVTGSGFILPQESKTFMSIGVLHTTGTPASVSITFSGMTWKKFSGYQEKPPITIVGKRYSELTSGPYFSEAFGTLMNDSAFDFRALLVKVILRDDTGKPIAINQSEMDTVLTKENREFTLKWPKAFPGKVATIDVEPDVDFFRDQSFIERYRIPEAFQQMRTK
ncbi:MAG: hypothetical protein WCL23_05375 [Candidatus Moraniibacteriota bacterium]